MIFKRVSEKCQGLNKKNTIICVLLGRYIDFGKTSVCISQKHGSRMGQISYFIVEMFRESQIVFVSSACLGYLV